MKKNIKKVQPIDKQYKPMNNLTKELMFSFDPSDEKSLVEDETKKKTFIKIV